MKLETPADPEATLAPHRYDVFLSFRGPDSRQGLTDVLYNDMVTAGIRVFRDNDELEIGDKITEILSALRSSKIFVPILSKTFAASAWCLREVEAMVGLEGRTIMPVFHTVTPDDVKLSTELFKEDLRKHEEKHGREQVKRWEDALIAVARIKGREVKSAGYAEFSKSFVGVIQNKLKVKTKYVTDCLIERDDQEQAVMKLMDIDDADVRIIGIHGMGGLGKTTLAKVIFNKLSSKFDCCSFLESVQESLRRNGADYLQRQLLEDLDPKLKRFQNINALRMLTQSFRDQKVLIVLDDVNRREEIQIIVKTLGWFGSGSRIIVTTRDKRVFTSEARVFNMEEMNRDQALQLFSRHAFGKDSPPSDYQSLSDEVLSLIGGLPLALEVIGSLLYQCEKKRWSATIERLKKVPNRDIQEKLKISFDALEHEQKQIFLDIACFFTACETSSAIYMWEDCDFFPDEGIDVLVSMCLVKITWDNKFWMHDLIRDLGRELVRAECFRDPIERSRIWSHKEAWQVMKAKQGKEKIEGLFVEKSGKETLANEEFSTFRCLRLLKIVGIKLRGDFKHLLPKLKWLSWHRCPLDFLPTNLSLTDLVVLDLSRSFISENWTGWNLIQEAKNLKVLDLNGCINLTSTPDLSNNDTLERLVLRGCRGLAKLHSSFRTLTRLKHLDLEGCYSLGGLLPEELASLVDLEEILVEGSGNTFHLPESIGKLRSLSVIKVSRVEITRIPDSVCELVNLTRLSLHNCTGITRLPDGIGDLKSLVELNVSQTKLTALPDSIGGLVRLKKLDVGYSKIVALPDTIGGLKALVELNAAQARLSTLPESIGGLVELQVLQLGSTKIEELPSSIGDLESLVHLDVSCTKVSALPDSVGQLGKLEYLSMYATGIEELPDAVGDLKTLRNLNLSFTRKLTGLPESVGRLAKLQKLILESSKVEELPESLGNLKSLQELELSSSRLTVLPDFVGDMSGLRRLRMDRCDVRKLPTSIGKLTQLTELSACSCKFLTEIPKEIGNLSVLRELRLTDTLVDVPELSSTINKLPHLQELKIAVSEDSASEKEVSQSTFQGLENVTGSTRLKLAIDCSSMKSIPQLPSKLIELELRHVTAETVLPDFSHLKSLEIVEFYYCSMNSKFASLWQLQNLKEAVLFSCTKELIHFSVLLENLNELTIVESSEEILDLPRSRNLPSLTLRDCRELRVIRGVGRLESLYFFRINDCPSLETVGDLSESKRLAYVRLLSCPKLRDVEGLSRLFIEDLSIHGCESLRNIEELKRRCRRGSFNGSEVENGPNGVYMTSYTPIVRLHEDSSDTNLIEIKFIQGNGSSGGGITRRSLEMFLKLHAEKELKYDHQDRASKAESSNHSGGQQSVDPASVQAVKVLNEYISQISVNRADSSQDEDTRRTQHEESLPSNGTATNIWPMIVNKEDAISEQSNVSTEGSSTRGHQEQMIEEMRRHMAQLDAVMRAQAEHNRTLCEQQHAMLQQQQGILWQQVMQQQTIFWQQSMQRQQQMEQQISMMQNFMLAMSQVLTQCMHHVLPQITASALASTSTSTSANSAPPPPTPAVDLDGLITGLNHLLPGRDHQGNDKKGDI